MWGQRSHNGVHQGKMSIFLAQKKNFKIFVENFFRSFFGSFLPKEIFYWFPVFRICTGCLPKYEWNFLKIGFKNTYFQVFAGFPAIPEGWPNLGRICLIFGQNGSFSNFRQKSETSMFFRLLRLGFVQKNEIAMCG